MSVPYLSVVIPCYNEEESLRELYLRVSPVCRSITPDYEIILVNDGSKDRTWEIMKKLSRTESSLVAVDLSRNHGHQLALTAGLSVCRGKRILVLDADLQDPPELLPKMMKLMDEGADVVYGKRIKRAGETFFKKISATIFYRMLRVMTEVDIPPDTGDFRLMSRRVLDVLQSMPEQQRFIRGMVSWVGFRQEPIHYHREERFAGTTKYPFRKMVRFAMDAVTGFSVLPLRMATYAGLFFSLIAVGILAYVLYSWFTGDTVHGWTSTVGVITLFGSLQLLLTGVIGEYLGRLYIESKRRPLFIIRDIAVSKKQKR